MWKFIGDGSQHVPGIPCEDMTDAAMEEHVRAGRLPLKSPAAKLWKREAAAKPKKQAEVN